MGWYWRTWGLEDLGKQLTVTTLSPRLPTLRDRIPNSMQCRNNIDYLGYLC